MQLKVFSWFIVILKGIFFKGKPKRNRKNVIYAEKEIAMV